MRVYCAWCQMEGKPGYLGEKEPFEEPGDTHGICAVHATQTLSHLAFRGGIHGAHTRRQHGMDEHDLVNARDRVNQWAEEGQYVLGRIIPELIERNERLRVKAESAEQDSEKMRQEMAGLREELSALRSDNAYLRNKQAEIMSALSKASDQIQQALMPFHDILGTLVSRRD